MFKHKTSVLFIKMKVTYCRKALTKIYYGVVKLINNWFKVCVYMMFMWWQTMQWKQKACFPIAKIHAFISPLGLHQQICCYLSFWLLFYFLCERNRESKSLLNAHGSQDWDRAGLRLQPGARNLIQFSHVDDKNPLLEPSLLPLSIGKKLVRSQSWAMNPGTLMWDKAS